MRNFSPNDVVMWSLDLKERPWSVEYQYTDNSHPHGLTVIVQGSRTVKAMSEELRPLTFGEFAWFKHPRTGGWMSGKTRGYMAIIIHLFSMLLAGAVASQGGSWWGICGLLPAGGYWWGTWNNYTGKWK